MFRESGHLKAISLLGGLEVVGAGSAGWETTGGGGGVASWFVGISRCGAIGGDVAWGATAGTFVDLRSRQ